MNRDETATSAGNGDGVVRSPAQVAYERLRRAIVACELAPGHEVTEAQLAAHLGVGRATLRSALGRLAHERLVQPMPRQGYRIAPITLKHVHDLFGVRLLLEPAAAALAASRLAAADLARLHTLNLARHVAGNRASQEAFLRANTEFHAIIARASGNDRLADMLIGVHAEMERLLNLSHLRADRNEATPREHAAILAALGDRDVTAAERAALAHIEPMRVFVIEQVLLNPNLQQVNLAAM